MINKKPCNTLLIIMFMMMLQPAFSQQKETDSAPENRSEKEKAEEGKNRPGTSSLKTETESGMRKFQSSSPAVSSPDELLGLSPEKESERLGIPEEFFTRRGEREWQDDAVVYFKNHIYLFWFKNRVWQFRADIRFGGSVLDVKPGMDRKDVGRILGKPFKREEGSEIYLNPKNITRYETGFPVRMKVFYDADERVSDIYVYRGDF